MRKSYGAIWDMENPPSGPLNLRFQLSASPIIDDITWVELSNIKRQSSARSIRYTQGLENDRIPKGELQVQVV